MTSSEKSDKKPTSGKVIVGIIFGCLALWLFVAGAGGGTSSGGPTWQEAPSSGYYESPSSPTRVDPQLDPDGNGRWDPKPPSGPYTSY